MSTSSEGVCDFGFCGGVLLRFRSHVAKAAAAIVGKDIAAMSCHVSKVWFCCWKVCSEMYEISMVPAGMAKETWLLAVSMYSGTLLRLMIEAASGRVTGCLWRLLCGVSNIWLFLRLSLG